MRVTTLLSLGAALAAASLDFPAIAVVENDDWREFSFPRAAFSVAPGESGDFSVASVGELEALVRHVEAVRALDGHADENGVSVWLGAKVIDAPEAGAGADLGDSAAGQPVDEAAGSGEAPPQDPAPEAPAPAAAAKTPTSRVKRA